MTGVCDQAKAQWLVLATFCFQTLLYPVELKGVCDQTEAQWFLSVFRQERGDGQTSERWKQTWEAAAPGKAGQYFWHAHSTDAGKIGVQGAHLCLLPLVYQMQTVLVDLGWISLPLQDCMSLVRLGNGSQVKSVLEGIKTYLKKKKKNYKQFSIHCCASH